MVATMHGCLYRRTASGPGNHAIVHKKLAHLNALRAFEAVARHLSFAKASVELGVTAGAISQQIKLIEDYYGVRLFLRQGRGISLTDDGASVLPELSAAFNFLARANARLQLHRSGGILRVTSPPTFSVKWLAPRLGLFSLAHPGIEVSVESTDRLVDLRREDDDIGIRYGGGSWAGLRADHLFDEKLTPVCSPSYLAANPITSAEDLCEAQLIHDRTMESSGLDYPTWEKWFATCELTPPERGALHFSSSLAAIQAAVDGHGVILGRSAVIDEELREGRLVAPIGRSISSGYAYYVVTVEQRLSEPVAALRVWLLDEAAEFESRI